MREAHPADGAWPIPVEGAGRIEDPRTLGERSTLASTCLARLDLEGVPAVVDDLDDAVCAAYGAWPDRLYLIGKDGRVTFRGQPGPLGFRPNDLAAAIREELEPK